MRYGFNFSLGVYKSLEALNNKQNKEYTVSDVLEHYITAEELNPSKTYKKTLYARVWAFLKKEVADGRCSVEHRKHLTRHVFIGYYKKID